MENLLKDRRHYRHRRDEKDLEHYYKKEWLKFDHYDASVEIHKSDRRMRFTERTLLDFETRRPLRRTQSVLAMNVRGRSMKFT